MAQPAPYQRGYSFRNFQTANPTTPLPGDKVDIEYNNVRITLDQILANLALIQRDDGRLANSSVGVSQMDGALISLGFERPTNWATATAYVVDAAVFENNKLYICLVAHTSATFATDLATGKWVETIDFTSLISDAEAARDAAQGYAADAQAAAASFGAQFALCVLKAGSTMTGELTLTGAGSLALHAATIAQTQSDIFAQAATVGGTGDAIVLTFSPTFAAWTANMRFRFTATAANTVTNPTINADSLGTKTVKKLNGAVLRAGDIAGSGHICECVYNGSDVILLNPALLNAAGTNTFTATQTFSGTAIFNGPVVEGLTTLTDAATIAWDLSTGGPDYEVTLGGNRALGAYTGSTNGQRGILRIKQDGTGGRTLDLSNAVYDYWGPTIEGIALGAGEVTEYDYKVVNSGSMFLKRRGATSIGGSGRDLLSVSTASASANINFVLTKWLSLYDRFEIDLENVAPATDDVGLVLRTSTDGGSTYAASAGNYKYILHWGNANDGNGQDFDNNADSIALVTRNGGAGRSIGNAAGENLSGTVTLCSPSSAARFKAFFVTTYIPANQTVLFISHARGTGVRDTAADVDAVRFLMTSGNIASGTFRLYGVRK